VRLIFQTIHYQKTTSKIYFAVTLKKIVFFGKMVVLACLFTRVYLDTCSSAWVKIRKKIKIMDWCFRRRRLVTETWMTTEIWSGKKKKMKKQWKLPRPPLQRPPMQRGAANDQDQREVTTQIKVQWEPEFFIPRLSNLMRCEFLPVVFHLAPPRRNYMTHSTFTVARLEALLTKSNGNHVWCYFLLNDRLAPFESKTYQAWWQSRGAISKRGLRHLT